MAAPGPIRDWHKIAVEMLMTDADLALQSITAFFAADDKEAVARVIQNAREVYESVLAKRKEIKFSAGDAADLDQRMDRLLARLKFLGERV